MDRHRSQTRACATVSVGRSRKAVPMPARAARDHGSLFTENLPKLVGQGHQKAWNWLISWRPQRESNPCLHRERVAQIQPRTQTDC